MNQISMQQHGTYVISMSAPSASRGILFSQCVYLSICLSVGLSQIVSIL